MLGVATLDKFIFNDPTGTMFGNVGHMVKNAYEGTIDNGLKRTDAAITEIREKIHDAMGNTKAVISKLPNPISVLWNTGKAAGLTINGITELVSDAASGVIHGAEVFYHKSVDTAQGAVHAIRGGIRNTIGRIPLLGRIINPLAKAATIVAGMAPTAIARIPASITTGIREGVNGHRKRFHDKLRSFFCISTDTATNDNQSVPPTAAPSEPAVATPETTPESATT